MLMASLYYETYSENKLYGMQLMCIQKKQLQKIVLKEALEDQYIALYHFVLLNVGVIFLYSASRIFIYFTTTNVQDRGALEQVNIVHVHLYVDC